MTVDFRMASKRIYTKLKVDVMSVCKYLVQIAVCIVVVTLSENCCIGQAGMRKEVAVQLIVPYHASVEKRFQSTHVTVKEIIKHGRETHYESLRHQFAINSWLNFTDTQTPEEILRIFCKEIFAKPVNTIVNLNYGTDTTSSYNYIMQLADHLGYPVISWDPNYPGALQVRAYSYYNTVLVR